MGTVKRIAKDAMGGIIFLAIAGALLIYFLGYPGVVATEGLAVVFLVSFVALRFAEIANLLIGKSGQRQGQGPGPGPVSRPKGPQ